MDKNNAVASKHRDKYIWENLDHVTGMIIIIIFLHMAIDYVEFIWN